MPVNLGADTLIPTSSTAPQKSDLRYTFTASEKLFTEYDCSDKSPHQQILSSVDEMFVRSLRHKYIGYGNKTTREMLNHLYSTYANIYPSDLQDNNSRLRTPYVSNKPIDNLTDQIENAVEYAAAGQTPYTPEQVVVVAYQLVFQTCLFLDDCNIWRRKDPADKTCTAFNIFFTISQQEWQESQVTTAGASFQTANTAVYQQDTVEAITNLATATDSDRSAVADLTATKRTLTTDIKACQSKIISSL